jgi:hypothetical protein
MGFIGNRSELVILYFDFLFLHGGTQRITEIHRECVGSNYDISRNISYIMFILLLYLVETTLVEVIDNQEFEKKLEYVLSHPKNIQKF